MSASRSGRKLALATTLTGLVAAPLAVIATSAPAHAAPVTIQVLATNDFHGRLINEDGTGGTTNGVTAGAAILSGAVKQLRAANPNTVFAAAGDLIGASTFESFIQHDKPTLDALNEAGLEVSAAGNHEFDAGYNDLVNRVMKPAERVQPRGRRQLAVPRGQRPQEVRQLVRPPGRGGLARHLRRRDLVQGLRQRPGGLRRCGHRGPARASSRPPASRTSRSPASSPR